ncbi:hypothetical protein GTY80_31435 [Amycolatopsis sp. SID8362]|uniref:sigma-70 region 4 domain-containing protein n=1 Tax=Amycolatopsis sp. SID8362 TaxID=2690346 RepID=UPI0013714738|nr:hypothetical protein [Amycolatopsis sp. SID8362]NED44429.1 hypothetical protein [Amycolatopsis sp. SID8362]
MLYRAVQPSAAIWTASTAAWRSSAGPGHRSPPAPARTPDRGGAGRGAHQRARAQDTAGAAVDAIGTDAALALIAKLPRDQAEAIMLRAVTGLDAPAAAKVLSKRPGAVRTAACRGLRTLAEQLPLPQPGRSRRSEAGVTDLRASTLKEVR